jgi:hypothetical protein
MTMPISQKKKDGGHIPGAQAVSNVIEIRFSVMLPNQKLIYHTAHGAFVGTAPSMATVAQALWSSISSAWSTNLAPLMSTATQFQQVFIRDMTAVTNAVFVGTGAAIPGTSASPAMPVNAAIVLTENVAQRGRGAKGRIYLGGFATNADVGNGLITAAAQTAINAFGTGLANAINAQSLTPCVAQVHRAQYQGVTGTVHAERQPSHVTVTSYTCQNLIWDTQRRRVQL